MKVGAFILNIMKEFKKSKVGEIHETKNFGNVEIIEQFSCDDMSIKIINDGSVITELTYQQIKKGAFKLTNEPIDYSEHLGSKIKMLTAISFGTSDSKVVCKCDCGNTKELKFKDFINSKIASCGCLTSKKNIIGETYHRLTIIGENPQKRQPSGKLVRRAYVRCECGVEKETCYRQLKRGRIKSCGCANTEHIESIKVGGEIGRVYGFWTVLSEGDGYYIDGERMCRTSFCKCICGKTKDILTNTLVKGTSKSCGCQGRPISEIVIKEKIIPTDTENEYWKESLNFKEYYISNLGNIFSYKTQKYLNTKNKTALELNSNGHYRRLNIAREVYATFKNDWNKSEYLLLYIDEDIFNSSLDNLFLTRFHKSGINWVSNAWQSMSAAGVANGKGNRKKERTLTKRDIIEQYLKQGNFSTFLNLPMDFTGIHPLLSVSVDRIDNALDYVPGNITLVTRFENMGRGKCSFDECKDMASHLIYDGSIDSKY